VDTAAWALADAQRIATRVRPQSLHAAAAEPVPAGVYSEHVDGRRHPELFLRFELFDRLLGAFSADQKRSTNAHRLYDRRLAAFGYESVNQFWAALDWAAQPYLSTVRTPVHAPRAAFTSRSGKKMVLPVALEQCRARAVALERARTLFGSADFDRVLYTVVAPQADHSFSATVNAAERAEQLEYMAGGCR